MNHSGSEPAWRGRSLVDGTAEGDFVRLSSPVSFWGGVDPARGEISDPRHPQFGQPLAGRVVAVPRTIGSSSSSAIMLELMRNGLAPAALVLGTIDAILVLGVVVGRELGSPALPVLHLPEELFAALPASGAARLADGTLRFE
jgi:uncharacterized protein